MELSQTNLKNLNDYNAEKDQLAQQKIKLKYSYFEESSKKFCKKIAAETLSISCLL